MRISALKNPENRTETVLSIRTGTSSKIGFHLDLGNLSESILAQESFFYLEPAPKNPHQNNVRFAVLGHDRCRAIPTNYTESERIWQKYAQITFS